MRYFFNFFSKIVVTRKKQPFSFSYFVVVVVVKKSTEKRVQTTKECHSNFLWTKKCALSHFFACLHNFFSAFFCDLYRGEWFLWELYIFFWVVNFWVFRSFASNRFLYNFFIRIFFENRNFSRSNFLLFSIEWHAYANIYCCRSTYRFQPTTLHTPDASQPLNPPRGRRPKPINPRGCRPKLLFLSSIPHLIG